MATIQFKKGDAYLAKLNQLSATVKDDVIGPAVYGAAGIVADAINQGISSLAVSEDPDKELLNSKQRKGLHDGLGIAKLRNDNGFYNVKIGWDGYNSIVTKSFPKGQPNQMIARSVERGTSFLKATPFVKRAVSATRARAIESMKQIVDQKTEEIMKG